MTLAATASDIADICRTGIPGYDPWAEPAGCVFDPVRAQLAVDFFPAFLAHQKGEWAGRPLTLERWQAAIVGNLFGWYRPDGTRRYRQAFILVPRKNGKTTLAAGIPILCLFTDGEPGAEAYVAAAEREQAGICYGLALAMVLASPELAPLVRPYKTFKSMEIPSLAAIFKALSSDAETKHGYNPHVVIADEVHAHRSRELCEVLHTGTGARRQPLEIYITTADYERESYCNELHDRARFARANPGGDPYFLPVVYEAADKDDWTDPELWKRVNPNYGVSVKPDYLAAECARALAEPSYLNTFKRLHLNIRTGQDVAWLNLEHWKACPRFEDHELTGPCYGGLDAGATSDLSAFALYWPAVHAVRVWCWVPEAQLGGKNRIQYHAWHASGALLSTPGDVTDYEFIRAKINELSKAHQIAAIGYDPWNITSLSTAMANEDGLPMKEFRQGTVTMNEPCKALERMVTARELRHNLDPVLTWCAGNAAVRPDSNGNIRVVKPDGKSHKKVDAIVAAAIAIGMSLLSEPVNDPQIYT